LTVTSATPALPSRAQCSVQLNNRIFFFHSCRAPRHLHSFPTRRSSDLARLSAAPRSWAASSGGRSRAGLGSLTREPDSPGARPRSEEHTSELQSRENLVCRLLLEKKKTLILHVEHALDCNKSGDEPQRF